MSNSSSRKVALVTGASRGIGAATAQRLARDGFHVVLHYGSGEAEAKAVKADIERAGGSASLVQADLSARDGADRLLAGLTEPHIDVLVNNAGVAPFVSIFDMDVDTYDQLSNVNMRAVFFVTQKVLTRMREGGRIINLSSIVARTAFPDIPAYSATKGFVDVLTLQLAATLGPRRITVNAVAPGVIETRLTTGLLENGGADAVQGMQALSGIATPDRVANVIAFLAGPDGSWTTGQVLDVSGGTKL
ncbi:MAG: SDR family oxidoreductase [Gammaproteobacteria bacterium]|jgi:3-oxoacyl-[acyl-carrier protein] reductase|nr:SDR family oxidoreductase [Gammaproteobacteria bacterium]MBU0773307.1 SDR family oxidoreductase [Gammaproteobacteria bacterium]MBU0858171.1 SDR family oxidoreductase [Gammaproteobacteria bacterium]MBU1846931.1 SDR family oxidoreductase [Gammaproteobacteria bacterium]